MRVVERLVKEQDFLTFASIVVGAYRKNERSSDNKRAVEKSFYGKSKS